MNSYDSVFLDTSLVARGEMPRNWLKVGGTKRTRNPIFEGRGIASLLGVTERTVLFRVVVF